MTLAQYMIEYTLEFVFNGNRSECARRMAMSFTEFKKLRSRVLNGGTSGRLQEAVLELFWRENLSLDDMLKSYTESCLGADIEEAEAMCEELTRIGQEMIESNRSTAQYNALLLQAAKSFFGAVVNYVCNHVCQKTGYEEGECPVARYLDYLKWLWDELGAGKENVNDACKGQIGKGID